MKKNIRICAISDTHTKHHELKLPEGIDILIHAGDISSVGARYEVNDFLDWFSAQDAQYKIFCAGNHDFWFEPSHPRNRSLKPSEDPRSIIPDNVIYLEDETIEIAGLKIFASPWSPWFHSWSFNAQRGEEINKHWQLIKPNTDIIITHGPPANCDFLDRCMDGQKVGCSDLTKRIVETKSCFLNIHGHIHEGYGHTTKEIMSEDGETVERVITFVNASVLNHRYELVNKPWVIEIDENKELKIIQ